MSSGSLPYIQLYEAQSGRANRLGKDFAAFLLDGGGGSFGVQFQMLIFCFFAAIIVFEGYTVKIVAILKPYVRRLSMPDSSARCLFDSNFSDFIRKDDFSILGEICDRFHGEAIKALP